MDNTIYQFKSVLIDGNTYGIEVHDLEYTMDITDHKDDYGFGESAQVITRIDFSDAVVYLSDEQMVLKNDLFSLTYSQDYIDVTPKHHNYEKIKEQITSHILDDIEFMQKWQDREFKEWHC